MAITFVIILVLMAAITFLRPLQKPMVLPVREAFDMRPSPVIKWLGVTVIALTIMLYIIFW